MTTGNDRYGAALLESLPVPVDEHSTCFWRRRRIWIGQDDGRAENYGRIRRHRCRRPRARPLLSRPSGAATRGAGVAQLRSSALAGHRPARGTPPPVARGTPCQPPRLRLLTPRKEGRDDARQTWLGDHRRGHPDLYRPGVEITDGCEGV